MFSVRAFTGAAVAPLIGSVTGGKLTCANYKVGTTLFVS
jgi:hypothetical protein